MDIIYIYDVWKTIIQKGVKLGQVAAENKILAGVIARDVYGEGSYVTNPVAVPFGKYSSNDEKLTKNNQKWAYQSLLELDSAGVLTASEKDIGNISTSKLNARVLLGKD